jgi:pSer/pThr/pTyr-binding forkhead associated (FHA) protein
METTGYRFCPFCQERSRADAVICEFCGKPLKSVSEAQPSTMDVTGDTKSFTEDFKEKIEQVNREVPVEGIAIYLLGLTHPIEVRLENEFVIGRLTEATEEKVVDLTLYNAFNLGVSRRHLMVRRAGDGYEVIDLKSSNGTWVDGQRLVLQQPFTVKSGSQIRLGNMRIFVAFRQQIVKEWR